METIKKNLENVYINGCSFSTLKLGNKIIFGLASEITCNRVFSGHLQDLRFRGDPVQNRELPLSSR